MVQPVFAEMNWAQTTIGYKGIYYLATDDEYFYVYDDGKQNQYVKLKLPTHTVTSQEIYSLFNAGNGLVKGSNNTISAKAGTNVTVNSNGINVNGTGTVANGNTGLISGGTAYTELRPENGDYVKKANTTATNLKALDTAVVGIKSGSTTLDSITTSGNATIGGNEKVNGTFESVGNATMDKNLTVKGNANITGNETVTGNETINGGQIFTIREDMKGLSKDIEQNKNNIRALNTSVIAALDSVTSMGLLVDAMDDIKADASLNNISDSGKGILNSYVTNIVQDYLAGRGLPPVEDTTMNGNNIISPTVYNTSSTLSVRDEGGGSLSVGHGSNVNGRSSIAMGVGNQVNANNSGIFGDPSVINADASYILGNDDTVNTGATGSFIVGNDSVSSAKGSLLLGSNSKSTKDAEDSIVIGNSAEVSVNNAIALGMGSIADVENTLSIGNSNLKRKIVNVADGDISQNSSEAVTGAQLFETNEKVQQNADVIDLHTQQIAQKADVDASNIDASLWSTKLGTGVVASGDTNLVTGGTVYNAIGTAMSNTVASISASVPVKVGEDDIILIGNNYGGDTVSVFNKDGEGRVITGVVTNPDDVSSTANVGYVDAVGRNILNGVNGVMSAMNSKVNKVGANAAALASLNPGSLDGDEKFGVAAAVGNYRDATAGAVGLFYKPQDNVTMNVRGSFGTDENMVGAGVYVALNKGNTPGVSKAQMVKTINAQAEQIDKQAKRIQQVEHENASMQQALLHMQVRLDALENKQ